MSVSFIDGAALVAGHVNGTSDNSSADPSLPPEVELNPADLLDLARAQLAEEWRQADPKDAGQVAAFYRTSSCVGPDLDAWHRTPERKETQRILVHVAQQCGPRGENGERSPARAVLDVGCGAGHDLKALREAGIPITVGVEPNWWLRGRLETEGFTVYPDLVGVQIEHADLILCIDVLEHVPDPESFLGGIARQARIGATLVETCSVYDIALPLHLPENRGWRPGRVMERHGWEIVDRTPNVRVWMRVREAAEAVASIILLSYRAVSVPTHESLLLLARKGYRNLTKTGDALVSRARSAVASQWWTETADDVFVMLDDDIIFDPRVVEELVRQCREGMDIVCAAYPVRNGGHLALRMLTTTNVGFGPHSDPIEIRYAASGLMAVHRKVLDGLIPTLPLCHGDQPWAFWPLFAPLVAVSPTTGLDEYLSEDWAFCHRARELGFKVWLDPRLRIAHLATVPIGVENMQAIHAALGGG